MKQKMTLDDFLQEPSNEGFLCTIEVVPNDNNKIKLIPWLDEKEGCNCEAAITLDKQLIESVSPTENFHLCCGKKHKVVEVFFKPDASIKVNDLIQMAISKSHHSNHEIANSLKVSSDFYQSGATVNPYSMSRANCPPGWYPCGPYNCYNPQNQCCCCDPRGNCWSKDNSGHRSCYYICGGG